ncbi:MAG: hypothetical protein P8Z70_14240, partial [Desulfuromonadales bacterium]
MSGSSIENHLLNEPLLKNNGFNQFVLLKTADIIFFLEMALDEARRMVKANRANFFFFNERGELTPFLEQ